MSITCKLTGNVGKGVKAHIIPAAFFRFSKIPSLIIHNSDHPKRSQTGLWDNTIVTAEGEKELEKLDDYATKLLLKNKNFHEIKKDNQPTVALSLSEYDYHKLKLFFLSVLWRMSVSSRLEFRGVSLGPHQKKIREMILKRSAKCPETYSITMFYFFEEFTKGMVLMPVREKFNDINYYRLHLGRYMALIKIDSRKSLKEFKEVQLDPAKPLCIIGREYSSSSEASLFKHLSDLNIPRFPNWFLEEASSLRN